MIRSTPSLDDDESHGQRHGNNDCYGPAQKHTRLSPYVDSADVSLSCGLAYFESVHRVTTSALRSLLSELYVLPGQTKRLRNEFQVQGKL